MSTLKLFELSESADIRGFSIALPHSAIEFLGRVEDIHLASVLPGCIRGNHLHANRKEVIIIHSSDSWLLGWRESGELQTQVITHCTVMLQIGVAVSHGIENTGSTPLIIGAFSNGRYDPMRSDTVRDAVVGLGS